MAATATLYHKPSYKVSSRTYFPVSICKYVPIESSPCSHCNILFRSKGYRSRKRTLTLQANKATVGEIPSGSGPRKGGGDGAERKWLRILVAGGGIGGLIFALAAKRKGFDVLVFEKEHSAIRGEGESRGPIQIQSNALAALEAIDLQVANQIMEAGYITGDRVNGLVDGISGSWFLKLDTFTPAVEEGLPLTRVINRITLQGIVACALGEDVILSDSKVVDFEDDGCKVNVKLENGNRYEGDLLVGADGIWSKVREKLLGPEEALYSGFTCYSGVVNFVPADIESVAYRIFLGQNQYFVVTDAGAGMMQWYAFHKEPLGGVDGPQGKKQRLLNMFEGWCDNVMDLILATDEDEIFRRDICDRTPTGNWGRGRVTLLGDAIHAMQPNLGQGGCMAIEDSYQLAMELDKAWKQSVESGIPIDVVASLKSYETARKKRVNIIHSMSRTASKMTSSYKAYIDIGLGPLPIKFRVRNPKNVFLTFALRFTMPFVFSWILSGYSTTLEERALCCRLSDKANINQLQRWLKDNDALERSMNGEWFLFPVGNGTVASQPICLSRDESKPCIIGSEKQNSFYGTSNVISSAQVSEMHAWINYKDGAFFLTDLRSEYGTYIIDKEGRRHTLAPHVSARIHPSDVIEFGSDEKVAFRVKVVRFPTKTAEKEMKIFKQSKNLAETLHSVI
uniref:Zeaxanthin epoxidase, chloroplastic n=1 Tax=Bixa orellana TaxID=66672 RepID=A0A140CWR4_BIXOR|nr:zeaxanthin epoxidase 2 [Bixa orellana]